MAPKNIKAFAEEDDRIEEGKKEREPEGPRRTGAREPEAELV